MGQCITLNVGNEGSISPATTSNTPSNVNIGTEEEEEEEEDCGCLFSSCLNAV